MDTHRILTVGDEYEVGFAEGKKAGIKEVVDWIEGLIRECGAEMTADGLKGTFKPIIFREDWQAKLRDWGIDA